MTAVAKKERTQRKANQQKTEEMYSWANTECSAAGTESCDDSHQQNREAGVVRVQDELKNNYALGSAAGVPQL